MTFISYERIPLLKVILDYADFRLWSCFAGRFLQGIQFLKLNGKVSTTRFLTIIGWIEDKQNFRGTLPYILPTMR
jgi:hypothetical protein